MSYEIVFYGLLSVASYLLIGRFCAIATLNAYRNWGNNRFRDVLLLPQYLDIISFAMVGPNKADIGLLNDSTPEGEKVRKDFLFGVMVTWLPRLIVLWFVSIFFNVIFGVFLILAWLRDFTIKILFRNQD